MKMKLKKSFKIIITILVILIILIIIGLFIFLKKPQEVSKNFVISFNSDGGSIVKDIIINDSTQIKEPQAPIKEGYSFLGWYYQDELFDFTKNIDKDIELIAKWEKIAVAKETIELSQNYYEVNIGDTINLEFIKLPKDTEVSNLKFLTTNSLIAKASNDGTIKALSPGKATITIKTSDNSIFTTCDVVVNSNVIEITKLSINGPKEVKVGDTIKLEAIISPSNATNKEVYWSSKKESIATISDDGTLKGISAGEVIITLTTMDLKSAETKITVIE